MSGTLAKRSCSVALVLLALALAPATRGQNCVWTGVTQIVAVGDVHGDYDQFVAALRAAGVIDGSNRWVAGTAHLVQTGDVLDRAPDSRKAMDLLMDLERQAVKAGGRVHALIGNHEAMVLQRDLRYVHLGEYASFGGEEAFRTALSPQGKYGQWILGHNAVIRINDVLFVHGGLSASYAGQPLEKINEAIRKELSGPDKPGRRVADDPSGPLWYRGLAIEDEPTVEQEAEIVLKAYGASRIVVGHTVSKDGFKVRAGGRVIMIDVGMSRYYGGPAAGLVIQDGRYFAVRPEGREELPVAVPARSVRSSVRRPRRTRPRFGSSRRRSRRLRPHRSHW